VSEKWSENFGRRRFKAVSHGEAIEARKLDRVGRPEFGNVHRYSATISLQSILAIDRVPLAIIVS
jgi:hypothetical protein